jgi:hypothetical protein
LNIPILILDRSAPGFGAKHFSIPIGFALAFPAHDFPILIFYAIGLHGDRKDRYTKKDNGNDRVQIILPEGNKKWTMKITPLNMPIMTPDRVSRQVT